MQIRLWDAVNLTGPIPEPSKNSFINLSNVSQMFYGCNKLNCEIPEKLFYNCPKITNFAGTFSNCGFIGKIPEKLFSKCKNVTSFSSCFRDNGFIEGPIPENLFKYNTEAVDFSYVFRATGNIHGNLPKNLFENNTKATKFEQCFWCKSGLTGEAPELWKRENITSYDKCFLNCINLSNYNQIPSSWGGGGE